MGCKKVLLSWRYLSNGKKFVDGDELKNNWRSEGKI